MSLIKCQEIIIGVSYLYSDMAFLMKVARFLVFVTFSFPRRSMHFCILGWLVYEVGIYLFLREITWGFLHSSIRWYSSPNSLSWMQRVQYLCSLGVLVYLPRTLGNLELFSLNAQRALLRIGAVEIRYFSSLKFVLKFTYTSQEGMFIR